MADDYRQRCADAAMNAWSMQAVVCGHTQTVPVGNLVDAVLAVPNPEVEQLRAAIADLNDLITQERAIHIETIRGEEQARAEAVRLRALLDGHEVTDDDPEPEPGYETVTAHLGELQPTTCPKCGSDDLLAAKIYGLAASSSRVMGEMAVCHGCGWSPYGDAVLVARADLDLVMNGAGRSESWETYAAACQRIRDALEGGTRG